MEKTSIKRFILLERNPTQTWELLTEPKHLEKWFCERAEVQGRPGGRFSFTGTGIVGGGTQTSFSRFQPHEEIEFPWEMESMRTDVAWKLERQLDMTRLVVSHAAASSPEVLFTAYCDHHDQNARNKICLDDIWWNAWGRLKYYVETGREPFKPDLSGAPSDTVVQEMTVDVSADQAFAALVEAKGLDAWMGQNSKPNLQVGEKFEVGWGTGPEAITEYTPGEKISYAWKCEHEPPTHVEWSVESKGAKAVIKLVHSGFAGHPLIFNDYNRGWAGFMVRLALYLETGIPARDWSGEEKGEA